MGHIVERLLIKENPQGKMYVYWDEWSNRLFLHIRYWYLDKRDGVEKPSMKGIAIPAHDMEAVLQAVAHCLQNKPDDPVPAYERKDKMRKRKAKEESASGEEASNAEIS